MNISEIGTREQSKLILEYHTSKKKNRRISDCQLKDRKSSIYEVGKFRFLICMRNGNIQRDATDREVEV